MIRDNLHSATIRAIRYDEATSELVVESVDGTLIRYVPVSYATYRAIASSRFPEKIYRHLIADRVLPQPVGG